MRRISWSRMTRKYVIKLRSKQKTPSENTYFQQTFALMVILVSISFINAISHISFDCALELWIGYLRKFVDRRMIKANPDTVNSPKIHKTSLTYHSTKTRIQNPHWSTHHNKSCGVEQQAFQHIIHLLSAAVDVDKLAGLSCDKRRTKKKKWTRFDVQMSPQQLFGHLEKNYKKLGKFFCGQLFNSPPIGCQPNVFIFNFLGNFYPFSPYPKVLSEYLCLQSE